LEKLLALEDDSLENFVLKDNNLAVIKSSPEFLTNKNPNTPTNRVLTSLFSKERLAFILNMLLPMWTRKRELKNT
jgi:type I restriction enzyme R subunit